MIETNPKNINNDQLKILSKNINKLMLEYNIDTKTLHLETGISISAINALKRGAGNPTLGTLIALANYFKTSLDKLIYDQNSDDQTQTSMINIPVFSIHDIEERSELNIKGYIQHPEEKEVNHSIFAIQLHNNTMSPFYEKGDIFIISPKMKYSDGDIVIIRTQDAVSCFRRVFSASDETLFSPISLNPSPTRYENYKVIGVVIKIIKNIH